MDKRQRKRRERLMRELEARASARREGEPGDATMYFSPKGWYGPGTPVVLYVRASARSQKGNMDWQELALLRYAAKRGWVVLAIVRSVGNCASSDLPLAIAIAETAGAIVFGEAVNRFLRPGDFDWTRQTEPDMQPTEEHFRKLMRSARGVPLVTLVPASATPQRVTAAQTKRGIEGAKEESRRELKMRTRAILRRVARKAKKRGMTHRAIVDLLRRNFGMKSSSTSTVDRLLKKNDRMRK